MGLVCNARRTLGSPAHFSLKMQAEDFAQLLGEAEHSCHLSDNMVKMLFAQLRQ